MNPVTSLDEFRSRHGEWTSMSIHLGGDTYTLPPAPDARLRRLVQVTSDLAGKPISQLRVLDLACREGHYAIDAMQGAEALGIEYRAESFAKARFVKDYLHLDRLTLYQDDLRNLSREKYGEFAVVICSGILYHLDAPLTITFTSSLNTVGRGEDRANCGTATQRVNPATNASSQTSFP
jgi:2-polyprenyl-3-methyl-5-hydroxy-6-metoxy-1,4-benzoquinol methylase